MECFKIAFIATILMPMTFAQYDVLSTLQLRITVSKNTTDLETALKNLNIEFNPRRVIHMVLNNVDMRNGSDFFKNTLQKFYNLTYLRIETGNIEVLPDSSFEKWNNKNDTKSVYLINIGLKNITKSLFEHIYKLNILNVSHNELTKLPKDVFQGTPDMFRLDLSYNKLDNLPAEIFKPIGDMEELYLQNNSITALNKDIFFNQIFLTHLNLSSNNINYTDGNIFDRMGRLIELRMSQAFSPNYNVEDLPSFRNLSTLRILYLDQNGFQKLPENVFSALEELELLNLSNNRITTLEPATFKSNSNLTALTLENNQLESLDDSLFHNLKKLTYLNLAKNRLIFHHGTQVFNWLFRLETIILEDNENVQLANSTDMDSKSVLYKCRDIKSISARNTSIPRIYDDWFYLEFLEHLDLRDTLVANSQLNFTFQSKSVSIDLMSNSNDFGALRSISTIKSNEDAGNRIILDTKPDCGENCACVFEITSKRDRMMLKCSRFDRTLLPYIIPKSIVYQALNKRVEFLLDNSNIGDLDVPFIANYADQMKVEKLSLSNNSLSSVMGLANQLAKLEILELDNNNFTSLDNNFVEKLRESRTLKNITLHGNQWDCSCNTRYFSSFVADYTNRNKIPQSDQIFCSNGQMVKLYDAEKDCDITRYELIYAAAGVALLAISCCIVVATYYRYELDVKIWVYHHREYFPSLFFSVDESFDRLKLYDAFVCYAKEDEEFVKTRLRPKLEDEEPKFKLCLHHRDWEPGRPITEQIYKSVANSRRTIIVLSHNFLNSHFCRQEFEAASTRSVQDKVGRVIVIMLEDIPRHRLTDELRAYITKYTYIPWRDNDWFWNKLRYVLPHKIKIQVTSLKTEIEVPCLQQQSKFWLRRVCGWLFKARSSKSKRNPGWQGTAENYVEVGLPVLAV